MTVEYDRVCRTHQRVCSPMSGGDARCPAGHVLRYDNEWELRQRARAPVPTDPELMLRHHAREAMALAEGSPIVAAAQLLSRAQHDVALRDALLQRGAKAAVLEVSPGAAIEPPAREEKRLAVPARATAAPPRANRAPSTRGLELVAVANLRNLMAYRLPDGSTLAAATREQLIDAARGAATTARESVIRSRWLRLVADQVPEGERVRAVLSERRLGILYGQAEQDMSRLGDQLRAQLEGTAAPLQVAR